MFGMMFWQSKKAKQQQAERQDFRSSLQPGTEVITIGGIIGKVVSVDTEYEEIVVDSEGSQLRFGFNAISREYVRPAYVHDDEVDENGNPLSKEDEPDQKPIVDATEEPAQDADVIQQPIDEQKNNLISFDFLDGENFHFLRFSPFFFARETYNSKCRKPR